MSCTKTQINSQSRIFANLRNLHVANISCNNVFILLLILLSQAVDLMWSGRLFHGIGAITEKVRFSLNYSGTSNSSLLANGRFPLGMYLCPSS